MRCQNYYNTAFSKYIIVFITYSYIANVRIIFNAVVFFLFNFFITLKNGEFFIEFVFFCR